VARIPAPAQREDTRDAGKPLPPREQIEAALFSNRPEPALAPKPARLAAFADEEDALPPPRNGLGADSVILNTFSHHYLNALHYVSIGEGARALGEFEKALVLEPDNLDCRLRYGDCWEALNESDRALTQYRIAAEKNPDAPRPQLKIGNHFLGQSSPEGLESARRAYQRALEIKPDYTHAFYNLGLVYQRLGNMPQSLSAFEKVIQLDPEYKEAWRMLGILHAQTPGQAPKALNYLRKYLELNGEDSEIVRELIEKLEKTGKGGKKKVSN
jgi:tetratricopeptide (TPR) repeat protein